MWKLWRISRLVSEVLSGDTWLITCLEWDPSNTFQHCQSVGSSGGQSCCPYAKLVNESTTTIATTSSSGCATLQGQPCVFPFTWQGVTYTSCTTAGGFDPWCSTATDHSGAHVTGNYGDCNDQCLQTSPSSTPSPISTTTPAQISGFDYNSFHASFSPIFHTFRNNSNKSIENCPLHLSLTYL